MVEFARRGEGEGEADERHQQHLPEEGAVQAVFGGERVLVEPGGERVAEAVAHADHGKGQAEHLHDVRQGGDARVFAFVGFHGFDDLFDAAGVRFQPAVNARRVARHRQYRKEPDGGECRVNQQHGAEQFAIDVVQLFHRSLVGRAANPAPGNGGKAAPDAVAIDPFRRDEVEDGEAQHAADDDGEAGGQEHRQHFPAKAEQFRHVHREGHEEEARREEVGGGEAVDLPAEVGGEDAGAVQPRRDEAAEDDAGEDGVEAPPEGMGAVASVEDGADDAHDEAEGGGQGGDKRVHARSRYCSAKAARARARWLKAFFSSAVYSAAVRVSLAGIKIGS